MPVADLGRSHVFVVLAICCVFINGCAHLEVIRLSSLPANTDQPSDETIILRLTQPAWEVEINNGSILTNGKIRVRPVNIADPQHVYRVTLVQGFLTSDRLRILEPRSLELDRDSELANSDVRKEGASLVYPEMLAGGAEFPEESEILARFRLSGQRVFIYIRPERPSLPLP